MPAPRDFFRIAEAQHGAIAASQHSRRRRSRSLVRVHRGVHRVRGAPVSFDQHVHAALLAVPRAAVSHRTAAWLWRLDGFGQPDRVDLIVPFGLDSRKPGLIVHRSRTLVRSDVTRLGNVLVTTPARTLIDLAGVAHDLAIELALDDSHRRGLVRLESLARRIAMMGKGCQGVGLLRKLILDRRDQPPTGSGLETRFYAALRSAGLPLPVRQHPVRDHEGSLIARVDFAYPDRKIALELDGLKWHIGRGRFESDHAKRLGINRAGWYLLAFTQRMVEHSPDGVGDAVLHAYREREG